MEPKTNCMAAWDKSISSGRQVERDIVLVLPSWFLKLFFLIV
jgi:hypothetical protein